ncbi:MAG: thioredoxin domain-containing protein, partial [Chitinophagaceae bacterium]|nr:thioredoxin domain-containing protein [Chitinophagaceae bacterium]
MYTNKLISETSVYLLQHAHNPVNWFTWGEEAFKLAKEENKPILLSIGYAACHWCHVMEKESFEDVETASLMNKYFINIKIDREERPDIDAIYMDAVQAITGSGGWPLHVFLTPDKKPFYGGTYFPPERKYNRLSWKEVLTNIADAYTNKYNEIEEQANKLTQHLQQSNFLNFQNLNLEEEHIFNEETDFEIASTILKSADMVDGGFGNAPKFLQTYSIQYLLRHYHFTKNIDALNHAVLSLNKMISGGIYDQLGGGFSRYSTDAQWHAPHFEKMLYDNALMVNL